MLVVHRPLRFVLLLLAPAVTGAEPSCVGDCPAPVNKASMLLQHKTAISKLASSSSSSSNSSSNSSSSGCNGNVCWPYDDFDCDEHSDCTNHHSMRSIGASKCGNSNCPWSSWDGRDDCCVKTPGDCDGDVCWPFEDFDCDSDSDCTDHKSMTDLGATVCGNSNCPWSSWDGRDDCCIKKIPGCQGDDCWPYRGFDCNSNSDCTEHASMTERQAVICGNGNCPWSSGGSKNDCCVKSVACGCGSAGCWPERDFDCNGNDDCTNNEHMMALGATVCGNANCPWGSYDVFTGLETKHDCCIRTACTGENFDHPGETFMGVVTPDTVHVIGDLEKVHLKVRKLSLLTGPTDGFGDFFGINGHDEVRFKASCPNGDTQEAPEQQYQTCDQRTNLFRLECGVQDLISGEGINMTLREVDTRVDEVKSELLDTAALLGMPVGTTTRVRFYLDNQQNIVDTLLLGLAENGMFEVCLSDVLMFVPGAGQMASAAVKAAKAARLSVKAVKRIAKVARAIKKGEKKIKRMEKNYNKNKKRIELAETKLSKALDTLEERGLVDSTPDIETKTLPDWPTLETALDAFDIIPCHDFAAGVIYEYTVYEAEISLDDSAAWCPSDGEEGCKSHKEVRSGLDDHGAEVECGESTQSESTQLPLPLSNGWSGYGHSYGTPTFTVANGICTVEGLIRHGNWGILANLPNTCRPSKKLIFNLNNNENTARVDVKTNGDIYWVAGGKSHSWISLSGIVFDSSTQQSSALPLSNGWSGYGSSYGTPTFTVANGICVVEGLIRNGGNWGIMANLPNTCRPSKKLIFNLNNNENTARVDVETNGNIQWVAGGKSHIHAWISLSGIVFFASSTQQSSALPLSNGWSGYGHSYGTPIVTVANGICIVEGLIRHGNWGILANLPNNCRPGKRLIFNLNNHDNTARVDVETNGNVIWIAGGKSHSWISLSGIAFAVSA